jgi:hypothetical protein
MLVARLGFTASELVKRGLHPPFISSRIKFVTRKDPKMCLYCHRGICQRRRGLIAFLVRRKAAPPLNLVVYHSHGFMCRNERPVRTSTKGNSLQGLFNFAWPLPSNVIALPLRKFSGMPMVDSLPPVGMQRSCYTFRRN